jgi:hypothetical protein
MTHRALIPLTTEVFGIQDHRTSRREEEEHGDGYGDQIATLVKALQGNEDDGESGGMLLPELDIRKVGAMPLVDCCSVSQKLGRRVRDGMQLWL